MVQGDEHHKNKGKNSVTCREEKCLPVNNSCEIDYWIQCRPNLNRELRIKATHTLELLEHEWPEGWEFKQIINVSINISVNHNFLFSVLMLVEKLPCYPTPFPHLTYIWSHWKKTTVHSQQHNQAVHHYRSNKIKPQQVII